MATAGLSADTLSKAEAVIACYPDRRSALIPLCHLAQGEHGYLTAEAMEEIARLIGCSPAEVKGTATFYDMLHTEPVGRYVIAICTNIACMLAGAYELLVHAEDRLEVRVGQTTRDGLFTLEEAECLAGCDQAVCVQVNHRFFGPVDEPAFDRLAEQLAEGSLSATVPPHGVLCRVSRTVGMPAKVGATASVSSNPQSAGEPPTPTRGTAAGPSGSGAHGPGESLAQGFDPRRMP
jgi:NADH-quinone oxidoreductase subunit E